jgi:hypothetical protein
MLLLKQHLQLPLVIGVIRPITCSCCGTGHGRPTKLLLLLPPLLLPPTPGGHACADTCTARIPSAPSGSTAGSPEPNSTPPCCQLLLLPPHQLLLLLLQHQLTLLPAAAAAAAAPG